MFSALRAPAPPRRITAVLLTLGMILGASVGHVIAVTSASASSVESAGGAAKTPTTRPARVLLIGDSILDQQGNAAAFLLRQAGVNAEAIGRWGSGLLTVDQYDFGVTKAGGWLRAAKREIARFDPDIVGVYMNHNYWPPFPHDSTGHVITDLWSGAGQRMIAQQARALITILRARGAEVFFIAPIPAGASANPSPNAWNPIWHGYAPVLRAMHVTVADTARPLEAADGLRAETKASCDGSRERVRLPDDVHLTRFGAGRAGTVLAEFVASLIHAHLRGNAAPGDADVALVPTPDGLGYWLVGCDGSVYHFGNAPRLTGARRAIAGHHGVATAVATPTGAGLWLVASDGTIVAVGDARPMAFAAQPRASIVDASAVPGSDGLWATTRTGSVLRAGAARAYGDLGRVHVNGEVVGIVATRDGRGYWLVASDGGVFGFGDARFHGSGTQLRLNAAVVGLAHTADDGGYWLVARDGGVFAFGDARFDGNGTWPPALASARPDTATPGPTIGIVASPRPAQGYWIFGATGRVAARGAVGHFGGDNNLALHTQ